MGERIVKRLVCLSTLLLSLCRYSRPYRGPSLSRHLRFLLPFGAPTGRIVTRDRGASEETAHGAPGEGE